MKLKLSTFTAFVYLPAVALILAAALFIAGCNEAHAQSNQPPLTPVTDQVHIYMVTNSSFGNRLETNAAEPPIPVRNASEALAALIHYEFPQVSFQGAVTFSGGLLALILCGARYLRKVIPDKWQVNKIGLLLAHAGGEVNPTIAKLALAAAEQALAAPSNPPPSTAGGT